MASDARNAATSWMERQFERANAIEDWDTRTDWDALTQVADLAEGFLREDRRRLIGLPDAHAAEVIESPPSKSR